MKAAGIEGRRGPGDHHAERADHQGLEDEEAERALARGIDSPIGTGSGQRGARSRGQRQWHRPRARH